MVESSIGISAPLIIGEESLFDPVVGVVTGIAYGGLKIFDKIRGRNNNDYVIDALTNEEEKKEPTAEDIMGSWRNVRSRDSRRRQPVEVPPHQLPLEDDLDPPEESYGWTDVIQQPIEPAQVIQEQQTLDHLDLVPRDVQIPLEEEKQPQPQFIDQEQEFENRQFGRPDPGDGPGGDGPGGDGPGGDPNPANQQPEEVKNNDRRIQDSPLFNNAVNQIANQITGLEKQKQDAEEQKKDATDLEKQRYIADIEMQIRSQQQLIDLLNKFSEGQLDAKQVNTELDQIQQLIQAEKIQQFAEDYVFSDVVESF